jgi:hypothetical protein
MEQIGWFPRPVSCWKELAFRLTHPTGRSTQAPLWRSGATVEVTVRTIQSRLLLRPSLALNERVIGVLFDITRLPCWEHLSAEEYRQRVAGLVEEIELDARAARLERQIPVMASARCCGRSPTPSRTRPRSRLLRDSMRRARIRDELRGAYGLFMAAFSGTGQVDWKHQREADVSGGKAGRGACSDRESPAATVGRGWRPSDSARIGRPCGRGILPASLESVRL